MLGHPVFAVVGELWSDDAIFPCPFLIVFFSWPLDIWLSLVLGGLVAPGCSRPVGLQVELLVPNGSRCLVVLCGGKPPGKQVELWPKQLSADTGLHVEMHTKRWSTDRTGQTSWLMGLLGVQRSEVCGVGISGVPGGSSPPRQKAKLY